MGWREILEVEAATVRETKAAQCGIRPPLQPRTQLPALGDSEAEKVLQQHPAEAARLRELCTAEGVSFQAMIQDPAELRGWMETVGENMLIAKGQIPPQFIGKAHCRNCGEVRCGPEADGMRLVACPLCFRR